VEQILVGAGAIAALSDSGPGRRRVGSGGRTSANGDHSAAADDDAAADVSNNAAADDDFAVHSGERVGRGDAGSAPLSGPLGRMSLGGEPHDCDCTPPIAKESGVEGRNGHGGDDDDGRRDHTFYPRTHVQQMIPEPPPLLTAPPADLQSCTGTGKRKEVHPDREVGSLFALFEDLITPSLDAQAVANVVRREKMRWAPSDIVSDDVCDANFPPDPVFGKPRLAGGGPSAILSAIPPSDHFLSLPPYIQSALLRILMRLLTGDDDDEYNETCLFPHFESEFGPSDHGKATEEMHHKSFMSMKRMLRQVDDVSVSDRLFRVVRFCAYGTWGSKDRFAAVESLLNLFIAASSQVGTSETRICYDRHVLGPLARLLSLVTAVGISPRQLKRIIDLITGEVCPLETASPLPLSSRLLLLRLLKESTEGRLAGLSANSAAAPHSFFVLARGSGIIRAVQPGGGLLAAHAKGGPRWPFKTDWAASIWFRADSFGSPKVVKGRGVAGGSEVEGPTLLSLRTADGAGVEIRLVPFATGAATLTITCYDSVPTPASLSTRSLTSALQSSQPQTARLKGCVLTPRVWYHLSLRHTKSRFRGFSLGNAVRDEITVILDGKIMMQEALRFPRASDPSSAYTIACGTHFDGQIGSIHIFREFVSDSTLRALFEETAGKAPGSATIRTDNAWSIRRDSYQKGSSLSLLTKPSLSRDRSGIAASTGSDSSITRWGRLDMMHQNSYGGVMTSGSDSNVFDKTSQGGLVEQSLVAWPVPAPEPVSASIIDLGEDEDRLSCRSELTAGPFKSRLLLVWDPSRVSGISGKGVVLEAHSSLHASFGNGTVSWTIAEVPKDVIGSMGGVQALLPIFLALLGKETSIEVDTGQAGGAVLIPLLLAVLAAFVRGRVENAHAMVRCSGIDIVEFCLRQNRNRPGQGFFLSAMDALRSSEKAAQLLVFVLNDMRSASAHYPDLYHAVFSRLLFNFALWFGGESARLPGVSLYSTLLPELSVITREEPAAVARCLRMASVVEFIKEHTYLGGDENEVRKIDVQDQSSLFDRCNDQVDPSTPLTVAERRHAIDIALGIIITVMSTSTTVEHLSPLLNYISLNMDLEWKDSTTSHESRSETVALDANRTERHLATTKTCAGLLFLMEVRPPVPGLYESMTSYLSSKDTVCSWILCCVVNTFDDFLRSVGIRLLISYLEVISPSSSKLSDGADSDVLTTQPQDTKRKITKTMQAMGSGLGINASHMLSAVLRSKISVGVVYKLLWHLLKCHRERIGDASHAAMLRLLLVEDAPMTADAENALSPLEGIVVPDISPRGYCFHMGWAAKGPSTPHLGTDSRQRIRNDHAISTFLRLLRFFPNEMKERCLFDVVTLVRDNPRTIKAILINSDWQPCLFHLLSESIEEISSIQAKSSSSVEVDVSNDRGEEKPIRKPSDKLEPLPVPVVSRYDLIVKLYSSLLGHSIRQGGDNSFQSVEQAASLQRVCVNGHETFLVLLSHVLAELIEHGTIENAETSEDSDPLKNSAMIVTKAIVSNGSNGLSMASAVKQWRCLRHLSAVTVAVITTSGFGVTQLFDYRNQHTDGTDERSIGLHGMCLARGLLPGIAATEAAIESSFNTHGSDSSPLRRSRTCVTLASQLLSLLDAFIFPGALDASASETQLHGLALVRSAEPRLGQAQGPLLASLLRLSMLLLSHLEPSSVAFLQCCSRLRCLLHWTLELIRESAVSGGDSTAFCVHTAKLDRLVLAVVLQCHSALLKCSVVLMEIDSSPIGKYLVKTESKERNLKRTLLRSTLELREIVASAFGGRNDVLRTGLSLESYEELQLALEAPAPIRRKTQHNSGENQMERRDESASKEDKLRAFLNSAWTTGFHGVEVAGGEISVPIMVSNGQVYKNRTASKAGYEAIIALAKETEDITNDFGRCLDDPFNLYLEEQRKWAETDAVYDLEYEGDVAIKRLAGHHRNDLIEAVQSVVVRDAGSAKSWDGVERRVREPWKERKHWKLAEYCDMRHRRTLLVYNRHFDSHHDASYELMLEQDRKRAAKQRAERLMRKKAEEDAAANAASGDLEGEGDKQGNGAVSAAAGPDDMAAAMQRARQGIIPMAQAMANLEEADKEEDKLVLEGTTEESENKDGDMNEGAGRTGASNWVEEDAMHDDDDRFKGKREEEEVPNEDAWAKSFIWAESERPVTRFESATVVKLQTIIEGKLLLTSHAIYFRATGDETSVISREAVTHRKDDPDRRNSRWRLNRLTEVHGRRFMLRAQALELFFADTKELFINFAGGVRERDKFYTKLRQRCRVPLLFSPKSLAPRTVFSKMNLTELWRRRKISNFDYLMHLNIMAGRTFNDLSQYPIFPWILADYTSETLNLNDSRVFRDLSKPVGALNPNRLAQLIERYNSLDEIGLPEEQKFLYGSHYSSPGFVLYYLIRQEPFTTMHIELQSGRFDCPDRLFFDIAECWKGCNTSTSDVKELIPEFFTCPEMFINSNGFPLGTTQRKVKVDDVKLPPWAKGSAHEFVRLHRLALESDYVSRNLNSWVDLIFGVKQRGDEAKKAHNNFHYLSYEGSVDLDKITNEVDRAATETHIQNFGVTPSQLLTKQPHPKRNLEETWKPLLNEDDLKDLRCFTPRKQFGGSSVSERVGAVLSIHPMSDQIAVIFSDLRVGLYQWTTSATSSGRSAASFIFKMDRIKALGCHDMSTSPAWAHMDEFVDRNGKVAVGSWSFAMTLGGSIMDSYQRRQASGKPRVTDMPLSTLEASSFLISCGYFDGNLKAHVLDSLRLKDSSGGGHRGGINCISMGDEGGLCVTGGQDGTVRVWVVDHNDMASALSDECVQTLPIAKSAVPKTKSGCILKCCHVLWGHTAAITCLSFSSDLDVVCSGSVDGVICIHNARRGKFIRRIIVQDFDSVVPCATCSQDDVIVRKLALDTHGTFVAHLNDGKLLLYSINGAKLCHVNAGEKLSAMEICGSMLVTGGESCRLVIRTLSDLSVRCALDLTSHGPIRCISLTPPGLNSAPQYMFVGTEDGKVTIIGRDGTSNGNSRAEGIAGDRDSNDKKERVLTQLINK